MNRQVHVYQPGSQGHVRLATRRKKKEVPRRKLVVLGHWTLVPEPRLEPIVVPAWERLARPLRISVCSFGALASYSLRLGSWLFDLLTPFSQPRVQRGIDEFLRNCIWCSGSSTAVQPELVAALSFSAATFPGSPPLPATPKPRPDPFPCSSR